MDDGGGQRGPSAPGRLPTGVPGLDRVLGGGLLVGSAVLVAGTPGTGKTTLGNHLAYSHAAAGSAQASAIPTRSRHVGTIRSPSMPPSCRRDEPGQAKASLAGFAVRSARRTSVVRPEMGRL